MFGAVLVVVAGFGLAIMASRLAVRQAGKMAYGLSVPPFIIGITFFAVGTDIPEIANSVIASLAGHGDLNVGNAIGSVVTQITLILGPFPFPGGPFFVGRYRAVATSSLTIVALFIAFVQTPSTRIERCRLKCSITPGSSSKPGLKRAPDLLFVG